jgi:hypothetical protein
MADIGEEVKTGELLRLFPAVLRRQCVEIRNGAEDRRSRIADPVIPDDLAAAVLELRNVGGR